MVLASADPASDATPAGRRLFLVDGSGYIFRAFHALPPLTRKDGTPVNAVYGFCTMLQKLLDTSEGDDVAVIFDASRRSFRNDIYAEYKANRSETPDELVPQFPLVREATHAFNLPCVEQAGYEADDLIATYARQAAGAGIEVVIVSSDKDLMQLVRDGVAMMDPMRNNAVIGPQEVRAKFGVPPEKVVDVQALAGDSVDNVPGVPGIGVKTAALLVNQFGDLDTILARADTIKQPKRRQSLIDFADQARISRDLVRLKDDVAVQVPLKELGREPADPSVLGAFLDVQGFRTIHERMKLRWFTEGLIDQHPAETAAAAGAAVSADYFVVGDMAALSAVFNEARASGVLGLTLYQADNETRPAQARLAGFALSPVPGRSCYVPLEHGATGPSIFLRKRAVIGKLYRVRRRARFGSCMCRRTRCTARSAPMIPRSLRRHPMRRIAPTRRQRQRQTIYYGPITIHMGFPRLRRTARITMGLISFLKSLSR